MGDKGKNSKKETKKDNDNQFTNLPGKKQQSKNFKCVVCKQLMQQTDVFFLHQECNQRMCFWCLFEFYKANKNKLLKKKQQIKNTKVNLAQNLKKQVKLKIPCCESLDYMIISKVFSFVLSCCPFDGFQCKSLKAIRCVNDLRISKQCYEYFKKHYDNSKKHQIMRRKLHEHYLIRCCRCQQTIINKIIDDKLEEKQIDFCDQCQKIYKKSLVVDIELNQDKCSICERKEITKKWIQLNQKINGKPNQPQRQFYLTVINEKHYCYLCFYKKWKSYYQKYEDTQITQSKFLNRTITAQEILYANCLTCGTYFIQTNNVFEFIDTSIKMENKVCTALCGACYIFYQDKSSAFSYILNLFKNYLRETKQSDKKLQRLQLINFIQKARHKIKKLDEQKSRNFEIIINNTILKEQLHPIQIKQKDTRKNQLNKLIMNLYANKQQKINENCIKYQQQQYKKSNYHKSQHHINQIAEDIHKLNQIFIDQSQKQQDINRNEYEILSNREYSKIRSNQNSFFIQNQSQENHVSHKQLEISTVNLVHSTQSFEQKLHPLNKLFTQNIRFNPIKKQSSNKIERGDKKNEKMNENSLKMQPKLNKIFFNQQMKIKAKRIQNKQQINNHKTITQFQKQVALKKQQSDAMNDQYGNTDIHSIKFNRWSKNCQIKVKNRNEQSDINRINSKTGTRFFKSVILSKAKLLTQQFSLKSTGMKKVQQKREKTKQKLQHQSVDKKNIQALKNVSSIKQQQFTEQKNNWKGSKELAFEVASFNLSTKDRNNSFALELQNEPNIRKLQDKEQHPQIKMSCIKKENEQSYSQSLTSLPHQSNVQQEIQQKQQSYVELNESFSSVNQSSPNKPKSSSSSSQIGKQTTNTSLIAGTFQSQNIHRHQISTQQSAVQHQSSKDLLSTQSLETQVTMMGQLQKTNAKSQNVIQPQVLIHFKAVQQPIMVENQNRDQMFLDSLCNSMRRYSLGRKQSESKFKEADVIEALNQQLCKSIGVQSESSRLQLKKIIHKGKINQQQQQKLTGLNNQQIYNFSEQKCYKQNCKNYQQLLNLDGLCDDCFFKYLLTEQSQSSKIDQLNIF